MPVVHSSDSALTTAGVLPGHGPSAKVSTTSLSRRKSSCLKCSKPKPGPPVVSISTTRPIPSASGLPEQATLGETGGLAAAGVAAAGAGAVAAAGGGAVAAPLAAGDCDHAALAASETAPARTSVTAMRMVIPLS